MQKLIVGCAAAAFVVCTALISASAQQGASAPEQPFFGLNLDSYGDRSPVRDSRFVLGADRSCEKMLMFSSDLRTEALEPEFQASLRRPITGERQVDALADPSLVSAELVNHFRILAGRTFHRTEEDAGPTVAILSRGDDHITFWRSMPYVYYNEVREAAREWCGRRQMQAVPQGQSRQCGAVMPFAGARFGGASSTAHNILNALTRDQRREIDEDACERVYGRRDACNAGGDVAQGVGGGEIQSTYYINHFTCEAR